MFTFGSAVKTLGVRHKKISKKKRRQRGRAMFRRKYRVGTEVRQNDCKSTNVNRRRSLLSHYVSRIIASTWRIERFPSQAIVVSATNVLPFQTMSCYLQRLNVTSIGPQYCRGKRVGRKLCCSGTDSGRHIYKGWSEFKKYFVKMNMCRFAYTTYEKTLIELKNFARGGLEDMSHFLVKNANPRWDCTMLLLHCINSIKFVHQALSV